MTILLKYLYPKNIKLAIIPLIANTLLLASCGGLFNKDNAPTPAPLVPITMRTVHVEQAWLSGDPTYLRGATLKLEPTLYRNRIYMVSDNGVLSAIDQQTGHIVWSYNTHLLLTSGPGVNHGIIVTGSNEGIVVALQEADGKPLWRATVAGQVIAKPLIANNRVIIKTTGGNLYALNSVNGDVIWSVSEQEPNLILHGASSPLLKDGALFTGFASGHLAKINLMNGKTDWKRLIAMPQGAFSIQRMVDIDANPATGDKRIFVATYQGKIAALDENHGDLFWSHDISSYTGMTSDERAVYISDAAGIISAFNIWDGTLLWQQNALTARNITSPVIMGSNIVVGDREGYLHWLNRQDGHLVHREFIGNAILATPIASNHTLYVLTDRGALVALNIR